MIVIDQLYGAISIPEWLRPVVNSPELQRLRGVRLINTTSTSCSALSDVRRFTHTLGVLNLALRIEKRISKDLSSEEARAFLVAALLHDVGTPAFGHLFEYQLAAIKGWDHEKFVSEIIRGIYRPEKRSHQIYYYNSLKLYQVLRELGIDVELVASLVRGETPLGKILAGSVDLDNIDGVFRMGVQLGLQPDLNAPIMIVDRIIPDNSSPIFEEDALPFLEVWKDIRRRVYQILAFDEFCLSGQAMLTDCLTLALKENLLGEEDWYLTDESLLQFLLEQDQTREVIKRFAIGDYYHSIFLGWYLCPKGQIDLRHPDNRLQLIDAIKERTGLTCSSYVFYDIGTFSKKLDMTLRKNGSDQYSISFSNKSQSTIVAIFTPLRNVPTNQKRMCQHIVDILEGYGLRSSDLMPTPDKRDIYDVPGQRTLSFRA